MSLGTVTVTRVGTKNNADDDAVRLGIELNAENHYSAEFEAELLVIDPGTGSSIVVKDNGRLYKVKLGEITKLEFPV